MLKLTIFAKGSDFWGLFSEREIGYLRWLTKGNRYKSDSIWWPTCFFLEPLLSCKRSPVMAGLAGTIQTALMFSGSKWAATKCCPALLKKTKRKKTNNPRVVVWPIRTLLCVDTKTPWMQKRNKCGFIKHWKHHIIFSIIHSIKDELEVSTFTRLRLKVISFHRRWFCFNCIRCFPAVFIRVGVPIDFGLYLLVLYAW